MKLKKIPCLLLCLSFLSTISSPAFSQSSLAKKASNKNATSTSSVEQNTSNLSDDVQRFNRELQIIRSEYVQKTSEHQLLQNAMQGMASGLDPHSNFLDAEDLKDLETATTGKFSGLGLEVAMEEGMLHVVTPIDDGPAQKAGIKPGDWIVRINNLPIQGMTLRDAVRKMRGIKGSSIRLTLLRKGLHKPFTLALKRQMIHVNSVKGRILEPGLAYVRISSFQESTRKDLDKLMASFQKKEKTPMKGVIMDLRNNPGGLLTSATDVANAFLNPDQMQYNKLIVYTQGQTAEANMHIAARPNEQIYKEALIVLINQGSASGAEIVAGALQDNKRAIILGTKSFGKGSVQTVIPLDHTAALKLTTALYYTPKGRSIQAEGITPDITVNELKVNTIDEDPINAISLHESELKGHLQNDNETTPKTVFEMPATVVANDLIKNDYQLFEAFNLLRGMVALQNNKA